MIILAVVIRLEGNSNPPSTIRWYLPRARVNEATSQKIHSDNEAWLNKLVVPVLLGQGTEGRTKAGEHAAKGAP